MNIVLVATGISLAAVLVAYMSLLGTRIKRLERGQRALLEGLAPSGRVRDLAVKPGGKMEAMRALRDESGVDVRVAEAVVDALAAQDR